MIFQFCSGIYLSLLLASAPVEVENRSQMPERAGMRLAISEVAAVRDKGV